MKVVVFLSGQNVASADKLHRVAAATVPPSQLEIIYCYDRLCSRLRKAPQEIAIVILLAIDETQLLRLVALKSLLDNVHTIIVLPDRKTETVHMGHQLQPRLIAYNGDDFGDVAAVISQITEKQVA
jgi:hypothetical protein